MHRGSLPARQVRGQSTSAPSGLVEQLREDQVPDEGRHRYGQRLRLVQVGEPAAILDCHQLRQPRGDMMTPPMGLLGPPHILHDLHSPQ